MIKMSEELKYYIEEMHSFAGNGQWDLFKTHLNKQGYDESQIEELEEEFDRFVESSCE